MRIIADTNVLVRAAIDDDSAQTVTAREHLRRAEHIAAPISALCEFAWVLRQSYRISARNVAASIRKLIASINVVVDRAAVEAGLAMLDSGGDFADGVIAFEGKALGGETFISFDRQAVNLLTARGESARLLG